MGSEEREAWTLMPLTESEYKRAWDEPWRQCVQLENADRTPGGSL